MNESIVQAIFNEQKFAEFNGRDPSEFLSHQHLGAEGEPVCKFTGVLRGEHLVSGDSAPFGGPDFRRTRERSGAVLEAVSASIAVFREQGAKQVEVRLRPFYYGDIETSVFFALVNLGFRVSSCDISHGIVLSEFDSADDYLESLTSPARRAVKHGMAVGFQFSRALTSDEWREAWHVLHENRASRGWSLSLSFEYVLALSSVYSSLIRMVTMRIEGVVCAAALVYRVTPDQDYVVYWGDANHSLERSPMNYFVYKVVEDSLRTGGKLLDCGTSSTDGQPNDGLIRFKTAIGGTAAPRCTLVAESDE